jgi:transcriptional regulator of acetoin/glycerol metabolism
MSERTVSVRRHRAAERRSRPRLRVVWSSAASPAPGTTFELAPRTTLIGRDPGLGGIALFADSCASRVHACLETHAGAVEVSDRGSRNGTFVDGERLAAGERRRLADGSVLRVGETLFVARADEAAEDADIPELVGDAPATRRLRADLARTAAHEATVLLVGETGTGKEVAAAAIHRLSRRTGPRVAVNMSAIPSELAESQLFGHVSGAFTGAKTQLGLLRSAKGGTLLLDEIGEMPLALQPKILRVVEERVVVPVGSARASPIDARLLAATHRDLERAISAGEFRADLYARLSELVVTLPPLRDRREDILALLAHACDGRLPELTAEVAEALVCHDWPRNVREVFTLATHIKVFGVDDRLAARLQTRNEAVPAEAPPRRRLARGTEPPTREELEAVMERSGGAVPREVRVEGPLALLRPAHRRSTSCASSTARPGRRCAAATSFRTGWSCAPAPTPRSTEASRRRSSGSTTGSARSPDR